MKQIKIGTWLEILIALVTFNHGEQISLWVAKTFFGKNSCGCCERKQWLNRLTNPQYDGGCDRIKI